MRILLDVHPMIRCGPEPIVTREILKYRRYMDNIGKWLQKSGYNSRVLDDATAAFITIVIKKMGRVAPRLCHKDPSTYIYLKDLGHLFPKAKFILMIRDGRAVVASTIA
ncbi:unnamed protein product [Trichobilharzia szidati]|nr:unnamed protein product [Trichobilharzia szidati]